MNPQESSEQLSKNEELPLEKNMEDPAVDETITTEESVVAEEPVTTDEPEATEEPVAVSEPEAVEEPAAESEPEAAEEPVAESEPEAAEEPVAVSEPEVTEELVAESEPEATEEPVADNEPEATEEPVAESEPEATEEPVAESEPEATEEEDVAQSTVAEEEVTKESVLHRLQEFAQQTKEISKQELDNLKQAFYKIRNAELEMEKQIHLDKGGTEETFMPLTDKVETEFKRLMNTLREKRNVAAAQLERIKEENLTLKLAIIDKLKDIVESSDDAGKWYNEFKRLQQHWNEIKLVPQAKANDLWKQYQHYVEKFYDILKLNNEFRDYDFKKNLEIKTRLCEAAEKLIDEPDVVSAFHQLQKLHQEFRDTGPVSKELREELWQRFKAASSIINRRHQQHFDQLKEEEQLNLDQKAIICEIVEAIEYDQLKSYGDWVVKTREIIALQKKWKTIGFAPHRQNVKIFERFRRACDDFFKRKGEFYKSLKDSMSANLEKKRALCEQAEALKESTDWKETTDILIKLQKEWKTIGPVQKKHSDVIWKRFIGACDYFFERKNKANVSTHSIEVDNLKKKKSILEQLADIDGKMDAEEATELIQELIKEWNEIGHVPFKDKDRLLKQYRELIDQLSERYHLNVSRKKYTGAAKASSSDKGGSSSLYRERERLNRQVESLKNDLQTYQNNLGFLNTTSQKGSTLLEDLQRKVEKLKNEIEQVQEKIKNIDLKIQEES